MTGCTIRPLRPDDHDNRDGWARLRTACLVFYGTAVADAVYDSAFARRLDDRIGQATPFIRYIRTP